MQILPNILRRPVLVLAAAMFLAGFGTTYFGTTRFSMTPPANAAGITVATADPARLRVVAFGSSSTQGVGASTPAHSYPSMLQTDLDAALPHGIAPTVVNLGHGGDDAEEMAAKLPAVLAERPDLVIWQTGTNDPLRGLSVARFVALTEAGLDTFKAAHVRVMLIEPQFCKAMLDHPASLAYRDALRRIAAERGLTIVRRYDLMQEWLIQGLVSETQLQSGDGLHMGDGGYALLAQYIARLIVPTPSRALTAAR